MHEVTMPPHHQALSGGAVMSEYLSRPTIAPSFHLPPFTRDRLIEEMAACQQTPTQSVLEHGRSVWSHFQQLSDHLAHGTDLPPWWRVPAWAYSPGLLDHLPSMAILEEYTIYHDAGKVVTRAVDADGRHHFPDHAKATETLWLSVGGNPQAARLMGMDMDAHLLKADGIHEFASRPEAPALLLVALAEVHSNAAMFGGTNSDSFKIKAKHLEKRGRQVMAICNQRIAPT